MANNIMTSELRQYVAEHIIANFLYPIRYHIISISALELIFNVLFFIFQIRFTCEIIVCLFCVAYIILEVIEIGSQGVMGFIKNCVSRLHVPDISSP